MNLKNYINESSLSRLWNHNQKHDCGALTAFRNDKTKKENKERNKILKAKLLSKGYQLTQLSGKYPEGGKVTKEISYFVVDGNDLGTLEKDLRKLGEEFEQDSILFIPKGAINNDAKAYLIGTNNSPNNWLKYGQKEYFSKGKIGYDSKIYTSFVNGRPFIFEDIEHEIETPKTGFGWWSLHRTAKTNIKTINEE